tara:strand:- start:2061 stop:2861 length:801 start_codon:yes stop_codon:yes gene_type:complete
MKLYFLTYGDSRFKYSKTHLCHLAKISGFYDGIINLSPLDLSADFKNDFKEILNYSRGGGYWIWKHEIIKQIMSTINEGDVILYCDAGSSINNLNNAKKRFTEYIDIIQDDNTSFLRFETEKQFIENQYTSTELFESLNININSEIANTTQLQAGVMFFKKNSITTSLLHEYRNILLKDSSLITDKYINNQHEAFIENRHDQSIFSLLGKKYRSHILENETEFRTRKHLQYDYPILTVRASNHGIKDKIKLSIFKKTYRGETNFFK